MRIYIVLFSVLSVITASASNCLAPCYTNSYKHCYELFFDTCTEGTCTTAGTICGGWLAFNENVYGDLVVDPTEQTGNIDYEHREPTLCGQLHWCRCTTGSTGLVCGQTLEKDDWFAGFFAPSGESCPLEDP